MSRGQNDGGPYSRCDGTDLECEHASEDARDVRDGGCEVEVGFREAQKLVSWRYVHSHSCERIRQEPVIHYSKPGTSHSL